MKYQTGDRILLLHSKEEGTVIDIINDKMVMVEVSGTSFPVYLDQIDFPYFHRFTQKQAPLPPKRTPGEEIRPEIRQVKPQIPQEPPKQQQKPLSKVQYHNNRAEKGVFLSMLPVFEFDGMDDVVSVLKFHLLNETNHVYNYHFEIWLKDALFLELKQEVHPFQHMYLADLQFDQLNDNPRFEFTFTPREADLKLAASYQKTWKVKAKQLFQQLGELQLKEKATIEYLLFDKYPLREDKEYGFTPQDLKKLSTLTTNVKVKETTPVTARYEIDLHIQKLTDDWKGLTNLEMLGIQLNEFQHYLDLAISQHQQSMIVIHGIGTGKLRDEVHEILKTTPEVKFFVNQYHPFYGYGATEIFFK